MLKAVKTKRLLKRFQKNEKGNVALTFAVSTVAVLGCMGAAMDFSTLSNAEDKSQSIADHTALSAAIFVKNYGRQPRPAVGNDDGSSGGNEDGPAPDPESEEGYLDKKFKIYTADELGYEFKGFVEGGAESVNIAITYDDENKEARVNVTGKTKPTFMQIFGTKQLDFEAEATAKYSDYNLYDPASVLLVLDNSGSMAFDDKPLFYVGDPDEFEVNVAGDDWADEDKKDWKSQEGVRPRIDALIEHSTNFYEKLFSLVGDQSSDKKKILRTGMLSYNTGTLSKGSVMMNWSIQSAVNSLNNMVAFGGTNSAPSLSTARSWMAGEDKKHENMHGEDPLKFVVFMSDGLNTTGGSTWVEEEGTGQWYGQRCVSYEEKKKGKGKGKGKDTNDGECKQYGFDTVESDTRPDFGFDWEEGKWGSTADISSIADCTAMKNEGVRIYTIGFALAEGWYDTNKYHGFEDFDYIDTETRDKAYSFLSQCASEPDTFLTAENASELEEAFERIGNDVATEIIRLSN